MLRSNNIQNSKIDLDDLVYVKPTKVKKKQFLRKGDILITASTGSIKVIGKNAFCERDYEASFGAFCKVVRPKDIIPSYLKHMFQSPQYFGYIQNIVNGANINNIKNEHLDNFKIPVPPLKTQIQIAKILDDAAALRDKTEHLLKEYGLLAQSIFLDMFGDPISLSSKFNRISLKDITDISSGSTPSRKIENNFNGHIPWVKTGEVNSTVIMDTEEKISDLGLKNSSCKIYDKGSIIIAMYGQGKTRGQVGLLGIPAATNQACAVLPPTEKMNFIYLYEYLKLVYNDLRSLGRGGNQPNLNAGLLKNYKVLNPSIKLQNQFAEKITLIEQQKELAKQELKESEDLFNCLLQKAFKGELIQV